VLSDSLPCHSSESRLTDMGWEKAPHLKENQVGVLPSLAFHVAVKGQL
jgi:hypothetical protein